MRFNTISTVEGIKKTVRQLRLMGAMWNDDGYYPIELPKTSFSRLLQDPYVQETYWPHLTPEARELIIDEKEIKLYGARITSYGE